MGVIALNKTVIVILYNYSKYYIIVVISYYHLTSILMIGKAIWLSVVILISTTFILRAMQGLEISAVFYEQSDIVLVSDNSNN